MNELSDAICLNGLLVMQNPITRSPFTPADIGAIRNHPLGHFWKETDQKASGDANAPFYPSTETANGKQAVVKSNVRERRW